MEKRQSDNERLMSAHGLDAALPGYSAAARQLAYGERCPDSSRAWVKGVGEKDICPLREKAAYGNTQRQVAACKGGVAQKCPIATHDAAAGYSAAPNISERTSGGGSKQRQVVERSIRRV